MAKNAVSLIIMDRERTRALTYLDRLTEARERGHCLLLAHAKAIIHQKTTGKPDANYLDYDWDDPQSKKLSGPAKQFEEAHKEMKHAADDLDNLAHLLRPFITDKDCIKEWARFGERRCYHDAQRAVQDEKWTAKTWTEASWEAEVIEPMKQHHANLLAQMQALRDRLCGAETKGETGRHGCKYEKSVAYAVEVKQRNPATEWREIWKECKRQIDTEPTWTNEELPPLEKIKTFEREVNRRLKKLVPSRDVI